MSNNHRLLIDIDKCVGCYSCEVACKQENELPLASRWCQVFSRGPREVDGQLHLDFIPVVCLHCDDPICAYFCNFGAITKGEDGLVRIGEDKCTGCGLCVYGCPYGAIFFDQEKGIAGKCSLCISRTDYGLEPSCVQHCTGGALQYVTDDELETITRGMHVAKFGKVAYTSSKWKLLQPK